MNQINSQNQHLIRLLVAWSSINSLTNTFFVTLMREREREREVTIPIKWTIYGAIWYAGVGQLIINIETGTWSLAINQMKLCKSVACKLMSLLLGHFFFFLKPWKVKYNCLWKLSIMGKIKGCMHLFPFQCPKL